MADTPITPFSANMSLVGALQPVGRGIVPTVGAIVLAGIAPVLQQRTGTVITPTVVAVTLAGVAGSLTFNAGELVFNPEVPFESGVVTWPNIPNGMAGLPSPYLRYRQAYFQVSGTFGTGGSVKLQGSNDGVTWTDLSPTALTATGWFAALAANEKPKYIRPNCTAGDGTTAIKVVAWFS